MVVGTGGTGGTGGAGGTGDYDIYDTGGTGGYDMYGTGSTGGTGGYDIYGTGGTGGYDIYGTGGTGGTGGYNIYGTGGTGGYASSYGTGGMGGGFFTASAGPDPMIMQMTMMGAQYDGIIGQVTAQVPGMQAQLLDLEIQAATNPTLAAALAPQIAALEEGIDGANDLFDAQSTFLDGISSVQEAQAATWESGMTNVKTASDGVANLASSIGDINTGTPPGGDSGGGSPFG